MTAPITPRYLDLDLLVEPFERQYRARVLNSPAGQADTLFVLPFDPTEIASFLGAIEQMRGRTRGSERGEDLVKAFGSRLFDAVFAGRVGAVYAASTSSASDRGAGLRLRLRLNNVPELTGLPWELLYDPAASRFLNLSIETPLVRYLELPNPARPLAIQPPLKILTLISIPKDAPLIDVEREWNNLASALSELVDHGLVVVEKSEQATLPELQRKLRQSHYHILHFIGHGLFDEARGESVLLFEDEQAAAMRVGGVELGALLHDHRTLSLVVLNAAEGGRTGRDGAAGVAQNLVRQGIPAVIAMQFAISETASLAFSREFYRALADSYPIDAAVAEARKAIYFDGNAWEWATPVLFMRTPDGVIFDVRGVPSTGSQSVPVPARSESRVQVEDLPFDELVTRAASAQHEGEIIYRDTPVEREVYEPKFREAEAYLTQADKLRSDQPQVLYQLAQVKLYLSPNNTTETRALLRRVQTLLADRDAKEDRNLLGHAYFLHATLTDPPNEKLLLRANDLFARAGNQEMLDKIAILTSALAKTAVPASELYGDALSNVERARNVSPTPQTTGPSPALPGGPADFNPIGRWDIEVHDMVGSRLYVEFKPNGTFEMAQQVGMYQVPVNGSWTYNPLTRQLGLQGVVNTFQPFVLALTLGTPLPDGFSAVGSDGIGYVLRQSSR